MDLVEQHSTDKDYQEFKDEISEVLTSVDKMHELPLLRAWAPCFLNHTCEDGQHVDSVSTLEDVFEKRRYHTSSLFHFKLVTSTLHLLKGQGIIGKALMFNQPFFSTIIASSSNTEDPLSGYAQLYGIRNAAVAIPLRSIRNADCILEFIFPLRCKNLEEQMTMLTALFSTLKQSCKTLSFVSEKVIVEKRNSPFPTFQVLQPFNPVQKIGHDDSLFRKENPREADPKGVMQFLPLSSAQSAIYSDPTSTTEPAEVCDTSLNDAVKCTGGFQGLFEHSKSIGMHPFQRRYQEFKDEISEVLKSVNELHKLPLARAWVPCVLNQTCQGVVGKAIMTKQPFVSTNIASSSNPEDPVSSCAKRYKISTAAVAIPLRSNHNTNCILEFLLPLDCKNREEQMKMLAALFSTLKQSCKTLSVVTEKVLVEKSNSPFPTIQVPQHFNSVERSDSLFRKENPREADTKHMMQLLPGSSAQNENCSDPTPSIEPTKACDGNGRNSFSSWVSRERIGVEHDRLFRMENPRQDVVGKLLLESSDQNENCQDLTPPCIEPAEVCDTVGLGILAVSGTSGERYATGEKAINGADTSLNDAAQSTKGKTLF
ncbi:hypothetical protein TIFTF001_027103 [Ficus carica]|uniref:NLP1-9 GAF domain-containing protein n=1 Tax=Ficus carica TaxID=3494 RepID=A0AA88IZR0_FICCA|nr:hypothetical protein TIFTF001_027103 [Ficus carica]